jgi:predicted SAM-dependent methyltransferase
MRWHRIHGPDVLHLRKRLRLAQPLLLPVPVRSGWSAIDHYYHDNDNDDHCIRHYDNCQHADLHYDNHIHEHCIYDDSLRDLHCGHRCLRLAQWLG